MLGLKFGLLLVLTIFSSSVLTQVYADGIFVKFDKSDYRTSESLLITGQISELTMPVIAMSIYDPNGKILSANNVEIEPDGLFLKTVLLDSPFYEKSGQYKIKLDYGQISQNEFFTISNPDVSAKITEKTSAPEIILLTTDKPQYTNNDVITIIGSVSALDSPTVLIGIYDTFGTPAGFYFGQVDSDLKFSTSFLAKAGINFKVDGTYSIKAHYSESSKSVSFDFFEIIEETILETETIDGSINTETHESNLKDNQNESTNTPISEPPSNFILDEKEKTTATKNSFADNNSSTANDSPKETMSADKSIIQNTSQEKIEEVKPGIIHSVIKNSQPQNDKKIEPLSFVESKKENNLTVEDIELGLILNQINLKCDSSKYTDTITYYDGMGPALYRLCKFDASLKFFDDSLLKEPENVEVLTNKGSTLGKLGHFSEAITYYDHALEIDPRFLPAINNKANALIHLGNYNDAKDLYELALENNPDYLTARKNLSILKSEFTSEKNTFSEQQHSLQKPDEIFDKDKFVNIEKSKLPELKKENQSNILEELTLVFSSLGSLFGFSN